MLPLRHARFWQLADLVLLFLVFLTALMPSAWFWNDKFRLMPWIQYSDKLQHAIAFFVLAVWFAGQYRRPSYWRIAVGLMMFGFLIEICQLMVGYREADWVDIGANTAGIFIGLAVAIAGIGGWCLRVENWYSAKNTGAGID